MLPPSIDKKPGFSANNSHAHIGENTGSTNKSSDVSRAEIDRIPLAIKEYANPIWNTPR